jgi:two-component system chemotaxis response regulator CheY
MSGIDLLRALRGTGLEIPLGFITSENSAEIKKIAIESGASFLITKPFDSESIQVALEPFLEGC